ncbi:hypothetical protein Z043_120110, partial [Scleropages formosus]
SQGGRAYPRTIGYKAEAVKQRQKLTIVQQLISDGHDLHNTLNEITPVTAQTLDTWNGGGKMRKSSHADAVLGSRVSGSKEEVMLFHPNVVEKQAHTGPGVEREHLTLFSTPVTSSTKAQGTPKDTNRKRSKGLTSKGYKKSRREERATPPADSRARLEVPITLGEESEVLSRMNRRKVPGLDGLPVEFYSTFWDILGPVFVEVVEELLTRGGPTWVNWEERLAIARRKKGLWKARTVWPLLEPLCKELNDEMALTFDDIMKRLP